MGANNGKQYGSEEWRLDPGIADYMSCGKLIFVVWTITCVENVPIHCGTAEHQEFAHIASHLKAEEIH
ncbi:hypothetical protein WISP_38666 [Willisornis vidua]|uniref:Uncharacterized protein n=1 Tax=Willisornis vidua TaxID=1566151 RepID=A0ABQ9DHL7_9PASS|nr:hypothetical protein WISP_38666 [Willisornis vidua]